MVHFALAIVSQQVGLPSLFPLVYSLRCSLTRERGSYRENAGVEELKINFKNSNWSRTGCTTYHVRREGAGLSNLPRRVRYQRRHCPVPQCCFKSSDSSNIHSSPRTLCSVFFYSIPWRPISRSSDLWVRSHVRMLPFSSFVPAFPPFLLSSVRATPQSRVSFSPKF